MFKRLYQQVVDSGKAAMVTVPGSQIRPEIKRTKTAKGMVRCLQLLSNGDHNLCVKGCGGVSSGVRDVHIEDGDDMDDSMDGCGAIPSHRLIYERDTLSQAYDVVRASGPEGISQSKLQRALRVDKLEGRMLCRTMDRHLLVKGIMEDEGRQRTTKFVAMEFVDCSELNLMFQREKARGHELGLVSPNSEKSPPFIPKPPSALPKPPSALPKPRGRPRGSTKARGAGQKKNKNARGRGRGRGVKEREEIINVGQMSLEDFPGNGDGAPANYITLTDVSLFESAEDGSSEALHSTQANRIPMDDNKGLSGSSEDNVGLIGPFKNSLAPSDLSEDIVGPCGIIGNTKEQFNAYFNAEDLKSSGRDVKEEVWMGQSQREVLNPVEALMRITALEMDGNVNTAEGPFITEETSLVKSVVEEEDVKDPKSQVPSPMDGKEIENVEEEIAGEKPNAENMAGKEEPEGVPVEEVMIQNNEQRGQSAKKRCKSNPGAGNKETYRLLRRQNLILEAIGSHRLIEGVFTLQKIIGDAEKSEGVGTKCCRKSVLRLVQRLAAEHLLRIYHTTILQDDAQHKVELIAHPSVSPKDPLMRSTLQQIRFRFSTLQHARKVSEEADQTHDAETTSHGEGNNSAEDGSPKKVLSAVHRQSHFCGMERRMGVPPLRNYKPTIVPGHGRDLGFQAKMPRLRTLHTFIWYIVYGHLEHNDRSSEAARAVKCGNDKAVGENQLGMSLDETPADGSQGGEIPDPKEKRPFSSDPAEVLVETSYAEEWQKEYAEEKLYVDETGWKRFVPPGPVHNDYGPGWIMIGDLFFCMPLSIFINLVQISYKVDNLEEYLNHPFRRNTLIRFLPLEMRQKLLHKRKYLASVFESIQRLCYMGLLQFGPADKYQERDQIFVYVKRHGTVMDTTMCEPHNKLARSTQPFPHHMYSFVVLQDVDNYWLHLQCVCLNTPLGIIRSTRKNCRLALFEDVEDGDSSSHCSLDKKCFGLHFTMGTKDIVDDGAVPGDGCGAGGLDSTFFGHLKRNWIWVSYIVASKNQGRPNRDKSTSIRLQTLLQKPSLSLMFLHNNEGQSGRGISGAWSPNVQAEEVAVRQVSRKDCDRKGGRGLKRKRLQKVVVRKPRKCARQEAKCTSGDGRPQVRLDEADRNAVDRMTKQRVSWTAHEDGLLLLCCVASAVLNSKVHRPFVSWQVIRDISHANFENSLDKTSHAVARRVRNILKNRESELNLRVCLAEVCQDRVLIEDFLSRQENYDIAKVCEAEYKELVEKLRSKFEHSDSSTGPMLPESLEELHQRFTMLDVSRRPEDLVMKDLQRQQSDSDEEDEDDEEEEEEYEGEKPKPRHSSRSWPIISAQLSSRVNYLLLRGCYMPGIGSVKGTNRSDNVVVNACQIRFGLRHSRAPYGLAPSTDARGNSYKVELAAAGLPLWFKKKRNAIDQECAQNTEVEMTVNESITSASLSTTVLSVVEQAGDIGLPLTALMQAVGFLGQIQELQDCVQDLLTQGALLEVGRSVPHLVCQSKARAWLIDLHRKQTAVHGSDIGESHSATKRCHNSDCDSPVSKRKVTAGNRAEDETPGNSAVDQQGPRTSEERVMDSQESFVLERIEELGKQLTEDAVTPVELPGNVCETSSLRDKPEHDNPNTCTDVLTEEVEKRKESLARILESFDASTLSDSQTSYIPRPWRIVDGTLNLPVCKGLLESLMYHIMTRPGITRRDLQNHYHLVLHPFILLEILKAVPESRRPPNGSPSPCVGSVNSRRRLLPMRGPKLSPPPAHVPCPTRVLEDAGCICKRHLLSCTRPSLFSQPTCPREFSLSPKPVESPSSTSPSVALLGEPESCTTFYEPIVDGVLKLAQLFPTENYWSKWLTYIHS
uniref:general transcription factor 3C polypeptide 1-like isoform X7 n=1 Tax=Myxine glutinosa TaxID=7769 RepID=UPI00358EB2B7